MKLNHILEAIGNTHHLRINRLFGDSHEVWCKLERSNPGGSIKDRIALAMIADAEKIIDAIKKSLGKKVCPEAAELTMPMEFTLYQNSPNPFNPETEIRFQLPETRHVILKIYNTLGHEIRTLMSRSFNAGYHSVRWDGKNNQGNPVSSGVYLYQIQVGRFNQIKKMSLLR